MGVGGLTTFVDDNNHLLTDHRLHDTRVVIDGNNLYHFLYFYYRVSIRFGGNLDDFADYVATYFNKLHTCNIQTYVVFDGAYAIDDRKLKTVMERAKDKILSSEAICKGFRGRYIPVFAYDAFKNTLSRLGVEHVTCTFEADDQIAALANAWSCPVMSNDSDFFIFDLKGGFIVFDYINLQVLTDERQSENSDSGATEKYKYLNVQIYYTKNLIDVFPSLDKSMLPLFACLYGNDVVQREYFEVFYAKAKFPSLSNLAAVWTSPGRKHDKILKLLLWLDDAESMQAAKETVLKHIVADSRVDVRKVRDLLNTSIDSYSITEGYLEGYFETGEMKWLVQTEPGRCELGPLWFLTAVCKGQIHTFVLNMFLLQRALLRCQIEDVKSPSAYRCAFGLRKILYSLVCGKEYTSVIEYDRHGIDYGHRSVDLVSVLPSGRNVPHLVEIPQLAHSVKLDFLLDAFDMQDHVTMKGVDNQLMLVILSIVYWVRNASPPVDELHLFSVLMCIVKIAIDLKIRGKQNAVHFLHKRLDGCPTDVLKEAQSNLSMFTKEPGPSNLFFVKNIHATAQFQGVLLAALELNSVLQDVVLPPCPSDILCGTFMYNLYRNLHKRKNPKSYLAQLLGGSPQLVSVMDQLTETISQFITKGAFAAVSGGKSKKGRKRKSRSKESALKSSGNSTDEESKELSADHVVQLAGNRFSLLALQNS